MPNSRELFVIADNIRSLYNVGSLFRLCDGVGVKKLYLCGETGAPFDRIKYQRQRQQIAKTALEGLDAVDWEYHADVHTVIKQLRERKVQIVAVEQTTTSVPYENFTFADSVCLILGNEVNGVTHSVLEDADAAIELSMSGQGKSLNVISAASVVLYHIRSQTTDK